MRRVNRPRIRRTRQHVRTLRRGNTIVLVTAILVLLAVVATAFVSRTQASRVAAGANQQSRAVDQRKSPILTQIADQVAQALFVRPITVSQSTGMPEGLATNEPAVAPSWAPRREPFPNAIRYGVDFIDVMRNSGGARAPGSDGLVDGYNFAPFSVIPWTNWPDVSTSQAGYGPFFPWPPPGVGTQVALDGNPLGNPGFGDTRWLRSTEPARVIVPTGSNGVPSEFFSHWPHLSWIPTAENGWRVCIDISDLGSGSLTDVPPSMLPEGFFPNTPYADVPPAVNSNRNRWGLDVPYEQWLPDSSPDYRWIQASGIDIAKLTNPPQVMTPECAAYWFRLLAFGNLVQPPTAPYACADAGDFAGTVGGWFSPNHWSVMQQPQFVLPNFLQLKWFGPQSDEFVCDSPRNIITRTLADADGDGFTDSFWFVAPASIDRSIKHVVAVSVVDNSGLLNVNTASRFDRTSTVGLTPADIALVTRMDTQHPRRADVPVGFLNSPLNQRSVQAVTSPIPPPGVAVDGVPYPGSLVEFDVDKWGVNGNSGNFTGNDAEPTFLREIAMLRDLPSGSAELVPSLEDSPFPTVLRDPLERTRYFKAMADGGRVGDYRRERESEDPSIEDRIYLAYGDSSGTIDDRTPQLTPFGIADEFELRSRHGSNDPALVSRLERAIDRNISGSNAPRFRFLRSSPEREETSEYFDSLTNDQLLHDNRRKLTTVNGARNDMMPPWMWTLPPQRGPGQPELRSDPRRPSYLAWGLAPVLRAPTYVPQGPQPVALPRPGFAPGPDLLAQYPDGNPDGDLQPGTLKDELLARDAFLDWNRKLDLNEPHPTAEDARNGEYVRAAFESIYSWLNRLTSILQMSFIDRRGIPSGPSATQPTYTLFGAWDRPLQQGNPNAEVWSQRLAASWAANILAARDAPVRAGSVERDHPLPPAFGLRVVNPEQGEDQRVFIGQEPQPFIAQAFFAFVYPRSEVSDRYCADLEAEDQLWDGDTCGSAYRMPKPFDRAGEYFINYDPSDPAAVPPAPVLVVQLINPYNQPVNLRNFTLYAFGQRFNFSNLPTTGWGYGLDPILGPATEEAPRSAIVFACPKELGGDPHFRAKMLAFLDLTHSWLLPPQGYDPSSDPAIHPNWPSNLRAELLAAEGDGVPVFPRDDQGQLVGDLFEDTGTVLADTMVFNASAGAGGGWSTNERDYRDLLANAGDRAGAIELRRKVSWVGPDPNLPPPTVSGVPPIVEVVVDRLQNEYDAYGTSPLIGGSGAVPLADSWRDVLRRMAEVPDPNNDDEILASQFVPPPVNVYYNPDDPAERPHYNALMIGNDGLWFTTWARISRPWVWDVNSDGAVSPNERSPRFVISSVDPTDRPAPQGTLTSSAQVVVKRQFGNQIRGDVARENTTPDGAPFEPNNPTKNLWMVRPRYRSPLGYSVIGKPTNFTLRTVAVAADDPSRRLRIYPGFNRLAVQGGAPGYQVVGQWPGKIGGFPPSEILGDTGATRFEHLAYRYPWRLAHRDGNFEHIAEIFDVPVYGPVIDANTAVTDQPRTVATFGELMAGAPDVDLASSTALQQVVFPNMALDAFGRFTFDPARAAPNQQLSISAGNSKVQPSFVPALPAGTSILDCLTIDGGGTRPGTGWSMQVVAPGATLRDRLRESVLEEERSPRLARGFRGESTPGLINVNTAPIEVLRALPNMTALSLNDAALGTDMPNLSPGPVACPNPQHPIGDSSSVAAISPDSDRRLFALPRTRVAESIINYRDQTRVYPGPSYVDRGFVPAGFDLVAREAQALERHPFHPGMRRERGVSSVGEIALLSRNLGWGAPDPISGALPEPEELLGLRRPQTANWSWNRSWSIDFAGDDPFRAEEDDQPPPPVSSGRSTPPPETLLAPLGGYGYTGSGFGSTVSGLAARMSTDRFPVVSQREQPFVPGVQAYREELPRSAGDRIEKNLLLKGVANLVTTRSDVFTVYVRIRSVAQSSGSGKWDATDPNTVIEDSRWVMVVDRSRVNRPGDQPEILMMQRVP